MKTYILDIYPKYFQPVLENIKRFEIRRDEGFQVGDKLMLNEFDPATLQHTGRYVFKTIIYICDYAQQEPYVVLGIE